MDLGAYQNGIRRAIAELLSIAEQEGERVGADTAALVEQRVVSEGKRADGGRFSPYSTKPAPAYLYFGRSRNAGAEQRVRAKAKAGQPISYREFRQINGLNVGQKNFQFTGRMWQGFGVKSVRAIRPGVVEVELGGKSPRSALLLSAHSNRENTPLSKPSARELEIVKNGITARFRAIIEANV
jgi:hypothetical protein